MKLPWSRGKIKDDSTSCKQPTNPHDLPPSEEEKKRILGEIEKIEEVIRSFPLEQETVLFKLGNVQGQVIRRKKLNNSGESYQGYISYPEDSLGELHSKLYQAKDTLQYFYGLVYDIRLPNGSIIGNLHYWEIERVKA